MTKPRNKHVFINCPFDAGYRPIFEAIVFTVYCLGFQARCALEDDDAGENRLAKIERIIEQCRYGIHDLSAVSLDTFTRLPRFNMPLELGLFLGCQRFGDKTQHLKRSLILDSKQHRYRKFISDISGQDVHTHRHQPRQAIIEVRNWLASASGEKRLPGSIDVALNYLQFRKALPALAASLHRDPVHLVFVDLSELITIWLTSNR